MSDDAQATSSLFRRLGRGGSLNLTGAITQQACLLATTAIIARVLGQESLGRYALSYALLSILSMTSLFGFRAAVTRFIAVHLVDEEPGKIRSLVRFSLIITGVVSLLLGLALVLLAGQIAGLFHNRGLTTGLVLVGCTLPAFTIRDLSLAATQGWRSQRAFTVIGWIYEPVVRVVLTATALALGWGLNGAFGALLVGSWTAAAAAVLALHRRLRPTPRGRVPFDARSVLSFSVVSWGTTLASTGLLWADTLLVGGLADAQAVGTYTVATRLVSLAVFVMAPINALFAPHFAHLHHSADTPGLTSTYAAATNWILRLSLPAFVVLVVFPADLLRLFGPGFAEGASVTVVLALGQLVNAATGPCGTLLNMSGRVMLNLGNNLVVLVLNVGLNLFLIPAYGIVGAAVAWSISLAVVNLARLAQVAHLMGLHPFQVVTIKTFAAGGAAAVVAVTTRLVFPDGPLTASIGVALACVTYLGVTLALRLSPEELEALRGAGRHDSVKPQGRVAG